MRRQQPRRPNLDWADRALLATLLSVIPKARRRGLQLLVTRARSCAGAATSSAAAGRWRHGKDPAQRPRGISCAAPIELKPNQSASSARSTIAPNGPACHSLLSFGV
jgi:hypothetical protein